ncbi:MAG: hypothetical protein JWM57_567 [Phycisphaerales bacterium]|nr:hypothetical protein [Phycisphaerales bacterium]
MARLSRQYVQGWFKMQNTSVTKICAVCGQDVRNLPRIKDASGRYHCEPCWENITTEGSGSVAAVKLPVAAGDADDNLIPFAEEFAQKRSAPRRPAHTAISTVSDASHAQPSGSRQQPIIQANDSRSNNREIPDYLVAVACWERRLLVVFIISIFPPLGILLIPIHFFVTYKLARAMDKSGVLWAIGTLVPFAGLAVLLILNLQATRLLKNAGLYAPMFRSWRWRN